MGRAVDSPNHGEAESGGATHASPMKKCFVGRGFFRGGSSPPLLRLRVPDVGMVIGVAEVDVIELLDLLVRDDADNVGTEGLGGNSRRLSCYSLWFLTFLLADIS